MKTTWSNPNGWKFFLLNPIYGEDHLLAFNIMMNTLLNFSNTVELFNLVEKTDGTPSQKLKMDGRKILSANLDNINKDQLLTLNKVMNTPILF